MGRSGLFVFFGEESRISRRGLVARDTIAKHKGTVRHDARASKSLVFFVDDQHANLPSVSPEGKGQGETAKPLVKGEATKLSPRRFVNPGARCYRARHAREKKAATTKFNRLIRKVRGGKLFVPGVTVENQEASLQRGRVRAATVPEEPFVRR